MKLFFLILPLFVFCCSCNTVDDFPGKRVAVAEKNGIQWKTENTIAKFDEDKESFFFVAIIEYGEYIDRLTFENIPFNVGSYDVFNRNFNDLSFTQFSYHYLSSDGDAVSDQYAINPNSTIPNILEVKKINGK